MVSTALNLDLLDLHPISYGCVCCSEMVIFRALWLIGTYQQVFMFSNEKT